MDLLQETAQTTQSEGKRTDSENIEVPIVEKIGTATMMMERTTDRIEHVAMSGASMKKKIPKETTKNGTGGQHAMWR